MASLRPHSAHDAAVQGLFLGPWIRVDKIEIIQPHGKTFVRRREVRGRPVGVLSIGGLPHEVVRDEASLRKTCFRTVGSGKIFRMRDEALLGFDPIRLESHSAGHDRHDTEPRAPFKHGCHATAQSSQRSVDRQIIRAHVSMKCRCLVMLIPNLLRVSPQVTEFDQ